MNLILILMLLLISCYNYYIVDSSSSSSTNEWHKRSKDNNNNDNGFVVNQSPTNWLHKCRTIEILIEMSKDEFGTNGELIRRCNGQALVNKCEGACISNLRPSIQAPTGLLKVLSMKECNCCRETSMHMKRIVLDNCFDQDGNLLAEEKMVITVNEPQNCACFQCAN